MSATIIAINDLSLLQRNRHNPAFEYWMGQVLLLNERSEETLSDNDRVFLRNRFNKGQKATEVTI